MSVEDFNRPPDWEYVQQTLMKSYFREWQRWFDFWSGRTALNLFENAHMMSRAPHTETRDVERGE